MITLTSTPTDNKKGAHQITNSIQALACKNHLAQQAEEDQRHKETTKTPDNLYGSDILKLLRWTQTQCSKDLPPFHHELANTPL